MADNRTEILNAAERRIRSGGYDGFSFREIASDVGVKSSSVHYYFPTKQDLGVAVAQRYTKQFFDSLDSYPGTPGERLTAAFAKAIQRDGQICLCGALGAASAVLPSPVALEARRFFERAIEFLLEGKRSTSTKERNWALQVISLLEGAMIVSLALSDAGAFRAATKLLPARPG